MRRLARAFADPLRKGPNFSTLVPLDSSAYAFKGAFAHARYVPKSHGMDQSLMVYCSKSMVNIGVQSAASSFRCLRGVLTINISINGHKFSLCRGSKAQ